MKYLALLVLSACSVLGGRPRESVLTDADKSFTYQSRDLGQLLSVFSRVLQKEGFTVQTPQATTLVAERDVTTELRKTNTQFNAQFSGGANYKISESQRLSLVLSHSAGGIVAHLAIVQVEKFSMGQESAAELRDPALYQRLFTQVKLGL